MGVVAGFIGPCYQALSPTWDAERSVNLFYERRIAGVPKSDAVLYSTPGLGGAVTFGVGPIRASFSQDGRTFVVSDQVFYEQVAGLPVVRGAVLNDLDDSQASIISNGQGGGQLLVIASLHGYVFNLSTNVLTEIADPDFPVGQALMCSFLDGYALVPLAGTIEFQISAADDFTSWDALDVGVKSQTSDNLVALAVNLDKKVVGLIGSQNTEWWWDSGASFPFEPIPNAITSQGGAASFGVCLADDAIVWIGQSTNGARMAYESTGTDARQVTTPAVSFAWSQYSTVSDCIGWVYEYRGHSFCVFTFPTADATWVYDRTEQQWHEWLYWNESTGFYNAHLGRCHCYSGNDHLVGSRVDGKVYILSGDYLSDGSDEIPIRRMRRSPHIATENNWIFCSMLQIDMQVGTGLTTGQGSDPQAMLRISRDAGRTYGNSRWTSVGKIGEYLKRVIWWRNGKWRDGVIEFTHSDPTIVAIVACYGLFEPGIS